MLSRLFGRKKPNFQEFPDALSLWMTCGMLNAGPIQLKKPYVSLVLNAKERGAAGQLLWIRVANGPEPFLDMLANIADFQFGKNGKALVAGDLVVWVPLQHMPGTGRGMNMSEDPRADYLGYITGQVRPAMNIQTGELSFIQQFPLKKQ